MQSPDKLKEYAKLVGEQLRWRKARPVVEEEIEVHLTDQRDALLRGGMGEEDATEESLRQMGDAVEIGARLDRIHRPKPAWSLFVLTGILLLLGLGIKSFLLAEGDVPYVLPRCILAATLGTGCLLGTYFLDFTILGKQPLRFYAASVLLVVGLAYTTPRIHGRSYYGAQLLLLFPLAYAALLYRLRNQREVGLLLSLGGLAVLCGCCTLVRSPAGVLLTVVSGLILLAVALWKDWFGLGKTRGLAFLGVVTGGSAGMLCFVLVRSGYAMHRLSMVLHPELDPSGGGFQGMVLGQLLEGARFFGQGGEISGTAASFALSNNCLLTYLIARVGWIALVVILAELVAFFAFAFRLWVRQGSMLGKLVSLAVLLTLALQTVLYLGANVGYPFVSALSLPLISDGNGALMVNMALIGVMLSAFRTGAVVRDGPALRKDRRVCWQDGKLTISFKRDPAS